MQHFVRLVSCARSGSYPLESFLTLVSLKETLYRYVLVFVIFFIFILLRGSAKQLSLLSLLSTTAKGNYRKILCALKKDWLGREYSLHLGIAKKTFFSFILKIWSQN